MPSPLRVVIAEDSALIREGIARIIEESGGIVVAKVGDGESFVEAVATHRPDVSVVDVRMPPSQRDINGNLVPMDAQINQGTGTVPGGEGVVYDPANDPNYANAASLAYPRKNYLICRSYVFLVIGDTGLNAQTFKGIQY